MEKRELLDSSGFSDLGPAGRLVTGLYYDVLGRQPQLAEVAGWTNSIGANLDNVRIAQAFIGSEEYHAKLLRDDYQTLLGRDADPAGLAGWLQRMRAGLTEQNVLIGFVSSNEYFATKGGTASGYVSGLYEDLLGRAPDQAGLAYWSGRLQSGTTRGVIATAFIHSTEGLYRQVVDAYHAILGREPDAAGANAWVARLAAGVPLEQMKVAMASSVEYFTQQLHIDLPVAGIPQRHAQPAHSAGSSKSLFSTPPGPGNGVVDVGSGVHADSRNGIFFIHDTPQQNGQVSHGKSVDFTEISLGVNPTNPLNLVTATAVIIPGNPRLPPPPAPIASYYTLDGGNTWHYVPIDATVDGLSGPDAFRADAEVRFDATGRLYVAYVAFSKGPAAGIGSDSLVIVAHSTDGGKTYAASNAIKEPFDKGFNDKEVLAVGRDPVNPSQQNVYVGWVRGTFDPALGLLNTIMISGSTNGGVSWSTPTQVSKVPHFINQFANPSVGPSGEINLSFYDLESGEIVFATSPTFTNGTFNFGPDITVTFVNDNFNKLSIPAQRNRGIAPIPKSVTDTSNGPFRGRIYIAYTDLPDDGKEPNFDVFLVSSSDHGQTWSLPKRINDDTGSNSQFNVDISLDPTTGGLSAEWRDARADSFNRKVDIFTATSADGGATFSTNVRVSDKSSDDSGSTDPNNFLEYDGIAAFRGKVYFAWADNSRNPNGNKAIFFDSLDTGLKPVVAPRVQVPPDAFEPNDTSDQATQFGILPASTVTFPNLSIGDHANGLPDYDWYQWIAGQDGTFTVSITYTSFDGGDLNLRLFTLDSQNHLIQLGSSRLVGVTSQSVSVSVTAGEPVLAWVYGFNRSEATYQMTVSLG